jgi:hypothetical protein
MTAKIANGILEARPTGHLMGKEFRWNETSIPKLAEGVSSPARILGSSYSGLPIHR